MYQWVSESRQTLNFETLKPRTLTVILDFEHQIIYHLMS